MEGPKLDVTVNWLRATPWSDAAAASLRAWSRRHAERRALAALDPEQLRDIGVHPADAYGEWSKPFWRR